MPVGIRRNLRATAKAERSSTCSTAAPGSASKIGGERQSRPRQRDIRDLVDPKARDHLDYLWACAVAENDWSFWSSRSKAVQAFVDAAVAYGKPYDLPSAYKVGGPLLKRLKADSDALVQPLKDTWKTVGCTLSVDGWSDLRSRSLVCLIAQNDTAPVLVEVVDSKTAKKTGVFLAGLIRSAICKIGDSSVVQVVMDNASNNRRAALELADGFPRVFFTNCAAHCLDLMLQDLGALDIIEQVLFQAHRCVMLVKNSSSAVTLFRKVFSELELVRPGTTRFGTQVIMITRFLEVKSAMMRMVISEEWKGVAVSKTKEGKNIKKLLLEDTFWEGVAAVLALMKPVYEVLRAVDRRSLLMGRIYGLMLDATVKTNAAAVAAETFFQVLLRSV
ncbi:hypothetical protein CLOM_g4013 [Closterium sp. NIES-68]|nr:hypothetical protein CLOM_g4013 [Closterium sp. NIES-68]GJP72530.1 hypothetical protein CLOP_g3257 [Closterium sp. NIES-67]